MATQTLTKTPAVNNKPKINNEKEFKSTLSEDENSDISGEIDIKAERFSMLLSEVTKETNIAELANTRSDNFQYAKFYLEITDIDDDDNQFSCILCQKTNKQEIDYYSGKMEIYDSEYNVSVFENDSPNVNAPQYKIKFYEI